MAFVVVEDLEVVEQRCSEHGPGGPDAAAVDVLELSYEVDQNASIAALSAGVPVRPKERRTFSSWAASQKAIEVYWLPWAAWWITPPAGRRRLMAMTRASTASSAVRRSLIAQPTTRPA